MDKFFLGVVIGIISIFDKRIAGLLSVISIGGIFGLVSVATPKPDVNFTTTNPQILHDPFEILFLIAIPMVFGVFISLMGYSVITSRE